MSSIQANQANQPDPIVQSSVAEQQALAYLRSTQAIRDRCGFLFDLACQDKLQSFRCNLNQLDRAATYVLKVMQQRYPDWQIPFHSRWRHFEAGNSDRIAYLNTVLAGLSPLEQARTQFDLVIVSVLLDAGAGLSWQYVEPNTNQVFRRSEGLAIASFHLFLQGGFSSDPNCPLQANAHGLQNFTESTLKQGFQVSEHNPLVGVSGRVQLMQQLGQVLQQSPLLFGADNPRPGYLVDYLMQQSGDGILSAHTVFEVVLAGFSEIWPGRSRLASVNLGDVWRHSALPKGTMGAQLVPFHKLSQWLTYSLLEPLQALGLTIVGLDELTGLPEYRNGGLCVDLGLLQPKSEAIVTQPHAVDSEVIVEWRALTVILIDRLAQTIRQKLSMTPETLPLAKVLEGGTWAAGRAIAADRRADGRPPIQIISDGTVF
ncbi:URC4/urg3 family protein [Thermocoleostomius sinensis A174]|uniref:URC4/urg3 family protein n=1 Tax=Thermocoleostomius sinensis A174 TaxID=2016057 RepID=A0A9E8ZDH7_9CYAN|nr:URC4/urg3 family protein [Thermocoleostomius sinensis A174]